MTNAHAPFHPIIYVRGYAMTQKEQDDTTADPFCGFNLGSTTYRAVLDKDKPARKFIFESPILRLSSEFGYRTVYEDGIDIVDADWQGDFEYRSVIVYRYYEEASALLGTGKLPTMEQFAKGLNDLVLRVRDLSIANSDNKVTKESFRCYLVAHSMGGLVCRAFLQNPALGDDEARQCIDKFFTYATPHNGIEIAGVNVPKWLSIDDMNNFNRERMAKYLNIQALYDKTNRVDWLPESAFPSQKCFCLVGTNRSDYDVASGLSRAFAGHGSDGLVKIDNASVWGVDDKGSFSGACATAHAYRSHSGYFGIVNSEESFQNLSRFLFGDVRADVWVDIDDVQLPPKLKDKEASVNALYQFEVLLSAKGQRWYLTRRVSEEDSPACRTHRQLNDGARSIYMTSAFLTFDNQDGKKRPALSYALTLGVRVPDYEVDNKFWFDGHYEGGYLFRDTLIVDLAPPVKDGQDWIVKQGWQSNKVGVATNKVNYQTLENGQIEIKVPFATGSAPGIGGQLRFVVSAWNTD
jgi:hypothetical protein